MKVRKIKSHRIESIIAIFGVFIFFVLDGTLAYFKDNAEVSNTFTIGKVDIELIEKTSGTAGGNDEVLYSTLLTSVTGTNSSGDTVTVDAISNITPGQVINKQPYVKNTGKNDAYVYVKVSVPKVSINGVQKELFSYTLNSGWTLIGSKNQTESNVEYKVYEYKYNNSLAPNNITPTIFDSVTVLDDVWTASDLENIAEIQKIDVKAYATQTQGMTIEEGYNLFFGVETVDDITALNYGQYVDIGTHILDLSSVTLADGSHPKSDWRVFKKDSTGAWLILSDYMPNSAFDVTSLGLSVGETGYEAYGVRSTVGRADLIGKLENESGWSALISGSYVSGVSGVKVRGALSLNDWIDSFNSNSEYSQLEALYYASPVTDVANAEGYKIAGGFTDKVGGSTPNTNGYYAYVSSNGYANTLYFPRRAVVDNCYAYWLASPSANSASYVMYVRCNGYVNYYSYYYSYLGVRPAVYLPSNIHLDTLRDVWTVSSN